MNTLTSAFQRLTATLTAPTRDELAAERRLLVATPPPAPATFGPPLATCHCHACVDQAQAEQAIRLEHASWEGRVRAIEAELLQRVYGPKPGALERELLEVVAQLGRDVDATLALPASSVIRHDEAGEVIGYTSTAAAIGQRAKRLMDLRGSLRNGGPYLDTAGLREAIAEGRRNRLAILGEDLETQTVDAATVARFDLTTRRPGEEKPPTDLTPSATPNTLEGEVRFRRRGERS